MTRNNLIWKIAFLLVILTVSGQGQSTSVHPEFEVASVKPNDSGSSNMGIFAQPGGRLGADNVPLQFLISAAYNVKEFQIVAGTFSWIAKDRYDITAKAPAGTPNGFEPLRPMLQSLLADRFQLTFHQTTREMPVYEIVAAKNGLKLTAKDVNCRPPDPKNPQPVQPNSLCNNLRMGRGLIDAHGVTMARLVFVLSQILGRVVIDKTGFTGVLDAHLEFAPDEAIVDPIIGGRTGQPSPASDSTAPSIFTVFQDQLGLRLNSTKGPVDVLIVDHAEKPAAN